jgi:hypothetical protein
MTRNIDIHTLLAKRRQIAVIWSIEDVQEIRPDLNDDQAWQVLQDVEHRHDAEHGISWITLQIIADEMFAPPRQTSQTMSDSGGSHE